MFFCTCNKLLLRNKLNNARLIKLVSSCEDSKIGMEGYKREGDQSKFTMSGEQKMKREEGVTVGNHSQ